MLSEGQQFVAFGVHPDTRQDYSWAGGEPGAVRYAELPPITEDEARQLIDDAAELLVRDHGYSRRSKGNGKITAPAHLAQCVMNGHGLSHDPDDLPALPDRAEVIAALGVVPSDGYDVWFRVGCALQNTFGDSAFDIFDVWSKKSPKWDARECQKQWRACVDYNFHAGTIFHYADQAAPEWRSQYAETSRETPDARNNSETRDAPLILSSADFVAGFVPPDYLIDGLVQRRFLYSMTAPTGDGKTCVAMRISAHVALGLPLAGREVEQGKVLFLAGENPDDVRMRWIKLCEEMEIDPHTNQVFWRAGSLSLSNKELRRRIDAETAAHGPFALVVVDTSAAFFEGDDENNNAQMGAHARMLRSLVNVAGGPTILVTCHPTKNANADNLLPRGGGAFLAEVDGNLVCQKQSDGQIVELHWHGKFRGPDFAPIPFKITAGTSERLKDGKGRPIWTVTARPATDNEKADAENTARRRQDELLVAMLRHSEASLANLACAAGWTYKSGAPNKTLANRTMQTLKVDGLVERKRGQWHLTKSGRVAARAAGGPI